MKETSRKGAEAMKQWQGRTQLLRLSLNELLQRRSVGGGRSQTVHLKEQSASNDKALIGGGDIPWKEVFRLCETLGGTGWYIAEQETYACPPLVTVQKCLQNLRDMGKWNKGPQLLLGAVLF